jgi:hypothetical protein
MTNCLITPPLSEVSINGANVGPTEDEYSSNGDGVFEEFDLGDVTLPAADNYSFTFTMIGHNSGSRGYIVCVAYIKLTPQ